MNGEDCIFAVSVERERVIKRQIGDWGSCIDIFLPFCFSV
jgi:hypothetical protein